MRHPGRTGINEAWVLQLSLSGVVCSILGFGAVILCARPAQVVGEPRKKEKALPGCHSLRPCMAHTSGTSSGVIKRASSSLQPGGIAWELSVGTRMLRLHARHHDPEPEGDRAGTLSCIHCEHSSWEGRTATFHEVPKIRDLVCCFVSRLWPVSGHVSALCPLPFTPLSRPLDK